MRRGLANAGFTRRGGHPKRDPGLRRVTKRLRTPSRTRVGIGRTLSWPDRIARQVVSRRVTTPSEEGVVTNLEALANYRCRRSSRTAVEHIRLGANPGEAPSVSRV